MAAPNIANLVLITAKTTVANASTTVANLVANPASSNKAFKINSLIISNVNGTSAADITADVFKNQSSSFRLAFTISVPADSTLVLVSKERSILDEFIEEIEGRRVLPPVPISAH